MADYNYPAAFIEYSKGTPLEDIALALQIPLGTLKHKVHIQGWKRLALEVPGVAAGPVDRAERDLAKIEANRARNFEIAQRLQENLFKLLDQLRAGTLTVQRVTPKGAIVNLPPSLKDLRDLSGHARDVAELSYRALGDVVASRDEGGPGGGSAPQQITIVLPGPVAEPRQHRTYDVESEVVAPPQLPGGITIKTVPLRQDVVPLPINGNDTQEPSASGSEG